MGSGGHEKGAAGMHPRPPLHPQPSGPKLLWHLRPPSSEHCSPPRYHKSSGPFCTLASLFPSVRGTCYRTLQRGGLACHTHHNLLLMLPVANYCTSVAHRPPPPPIFYHCGTPTPTHLSTSAFSYANSASCSTPRKVYSLSCDILRKLNQKIDSHSRPPLPQSLPGILGLGLAWLWQSAVWSLSGAWGSNGARLRRQGRGLP